MTDKLQDIQQAPEVLSDSLEPSSAGSDDAERDLRRAIKNMSLFGGSAHWGENPHDPPPNNQFGVFDPEYTSILYLGFNTNWTVRVNHACYHTGQKSGQERLIKAVDVIREVVTSGDRFKDHPGQNPYVRQNPPYRNEMDSETFDNFRFRRPTEIFIYLHQVGLGAKDRTTLSLQNRELISFGGRAHERDAFGQPRMGSFNYSFFNAKPVVQYDALLERVGVLIRMENWVKNEDGADIVTPDQAYAMNIHFSILGHKGVSIPMIFDPDTGNGLGNEP
jgi:hypothetical protein